MCPTTAATTTTTTNYYYLDKLPAAFIQRHEIDPFGTDTQEFSWDEGNEPLQVARQRLDAGFELFSKLGVPYYCCYYYYYY